MLLNFDVMTVFKQFGLLIVVVEHFKSTFCHWRKRIEDQERKNIFWNLSKVGVTFQRVIFYDV